MTNLSYFESRKGRLTCTAKSAFTFITDIRNFEQFIPPGTITNWHAERDSCSFSVSMLGTVTLRLDKKEEYSKVVFTGDALKKNDFELGLSITDNSGLPADVHVELKADLNPMMKMIAAKPIGQFLEMLVNEMEKFGGWEQIKK